MIHTKELRAGNKVRTQYGQVITVQQILSSTLIYDSKIEVLREVIRVNGSQVRDYVDQLNEIVKEADCQDVEPIGLTDDILRKCGLEIFCANNGYLKSVTVISTGNLKIVPSG